jgi:hypothetical protein
MAQQESPQLRRLRADHDRILQLIGQTDFIRIVSTGGNPPHTYTLEYTCRGVERVEDKRIVTRDSHRVVISLPSDYPTGKPNIRFETPIFHPNINSVGALCIGPWWAAKWLDELALMVAEMIQYKVPPTRDTMVDVLNQSAVVWLQNNRSQLPIDKRDIKNDLFGRIRILDTNSEGDDFEIHIYK